MAGHLSNGIISNLLSYSMIPNVILFDCEEVEPGKLDNSICLTLEKPVKIIKKPVTFKPTPKKKVTEIKTELVLSIEELKEKELSLLHGDDYAVLHFQNVFGNISIIEDEIVEIVKLFKYTTTLDGFDFNYEKNLGVLMGTVDVTIKLNLYDEHRINCNVYFYKIKNSKTGLDFKITFRQKEYYTYLNIKHKYITFWFENGKIKKVSASMLFDYFIGRKKLGLLKQLYYDIFNKGVDIEQAPELFVEHYKNEKDEMLSFLNFLNVIPSKIVPGLCAEIKTKFEKHFEINKKVNDFKVDEFL